MNFEEIKTIILVDDRASYYSDGGYGAPPRQNRYKILFSTLKEKMKKVEKEYLILGDGIFEINDKSETLIKTEDKTMFSGNSAAKKISDKIQSLSDSKKALLLIDYMLNNSTKKQDKGKALALDILRLTPSDIIKLLYSTSPENKKEMNDFEWAYIFDFPISSPTDAAEEIIYVLENRGD